MKKNIKFTFILIVTCCTTCFSQLKINSSGEVMIGTNDPLNKFHVHGHINISDDWNGGWHHLRLLACNNDNFGQIGSNWGAIKFWYPGVGANTIWCHWNDWSDSLLKTNIASLGSCLLKIKSLNGVKFQYRQMADSTSFSDSPDSTGFHYGVIAQQVEKVFPDLVSVAGGYKAVSYGGLIAVLLNGINEQQQIIDSMHVQDSLMDARISTLESVVANCCSGQRMGSNTNHEGNADDSTHSKTIELSNLKAIILDQNVPNPFAEQTTITYFIPDNVVSAQIIFYDNKGNVLKSLEIREQGHGELKVYAPNLSSGIYSYSILVDGNVIQTKKMVCSK